MRLPGFRNSTTYTGRHLIPAETVTRKHYRNWNRDTQSSSNLSNDTLYKGETIAEYHTTVAEVTNAEEVADFSIGTFPVSGPENASITLKLYADDHSGSHIYQKTLNNISILRNQLTRISTDFNHSILGNSGFSIAINPDWDGIHDDDETIIP